MNWNHKNDAKETQLDAIIEQKKQSNDDVVNLLVQTTPQADSPTRDVLEDLLIAKLTSNQHSGRVLKMQAIQSKSGTVIEFPKTTRRIPLVFVATLAVAIIGMAVIFLSQRASDSPSFGTGGDGDPIQQMGGTTKEAETPAINPLNCIIHTIAEGDTLFGIAQSYDVDAFEMFRINGLDNQSAGNLTVGEPLIIPVDGCVLNNSQIALATVTPMPSFTATASPTIVSTAVPFPTAIFTATPIPSSGGSTVFGGTTLQTDADLTVYSLPDANSEVLGEYLAGEFVTIIGQDRTGGWLVVSWDGNIVGWVRSFVMQNELEAEPIMGKPTALPYTATPLATQPNLPGEPTAMPLTIIPTALPDDLCTVTLGGNVDTPVYVSPDITSEQISILSPRAVLKMVERQPHENDFDLWVLVPINLDGNRVLGWILLDRNNGGSFTCPAS